MCESSSGWLLSESGNVLQCEQCLVDSLQHPQLKYRRQFQTQIVRLYVLNLSTHFNQIFLSPQNFYLHSQMIPQTLWIQTNDIGNVEVCYVSQEKHDPGCFFCPTLCTNIFYINLHIIHIIAFYLKFHVHYLWLHDQNKWFRLCVFCMKHLLNAVCLCLCYVLCGR